MIRRPTTSAVLLAAAATVIYALLWVGHRQDWAWLHATDWCLLNTAHDIGVKHPAWVRFWVVVSFVLGPIPTRLLGMVVVVIALVQRKVRMALLLFACLPLNGLVTMVAKGLAGRPRPLTEFVTAPSSSFPSGHALELMAAVLALLTFLLPILTIPWTRVLLVGAAVVSVLTVGAARVALNVHHPTDVAAGWSLGCAYFLLCLWVFRPVTATDDEPAELAEAG
ncbi:phosphatase PAP2 family protein [Mycobacterium simiae]|uniref:Phosphatase PAP2 family protein n=1 Tax=Mycobacterium simiae TaxID=1784 RepID=A0A5B1BL34_MYCSI|nr:phosphatase PAP2 family protein [Mycobacterium simiae]KAA1249397.1 phosphatase PAP2 family protein [Mycobacterium simiae]